MFLHKSIHTSLSNDRLEPQLLHFPVDFLFLAVIQGSSQSQTAPLRLLLKIFEKVVLFKSLERDIVKIQRLGGADRTAPRRISLNQTNVGPGSFPGAFAEWLRRRQLSV